jgi:AcrR family transcriptional regulator
MSGKGHKTKVQDRRSQRTHKALLQAFLVLLRQRKYGQIHVADIIAKADVARSTFYDHFKSKDDVLLESMSGIYATLADIVEKDAKPERLVGLLQHFWDNRLLARDLFSGPSAALGPKHGTRHLACAIEERLAAQYRFRKIEPEVPLWLAAIQVAEGTMALLRDWLTGKAACGPASLAKGLHAAATACAGAFLAPR